MSWFVQKFDIHGRVHIVVLIVAEGGLLEVSVFLQRRAWGVPLSLGTSGWFRTSRFVRGGRVRAEPCRASPA